MSTFPMTAPEAAPRRWPFLLVVTIGVLCYASMKLLGAYAPELITKPEQFPIFNLALFGPMVCAAVLAILWLAMGPDRFVVRAVTLLAALGVGAGAMLLAHPGTRQWLSTWGLPAAAGVAALAAVMTWPLRPLGRYAFAGLLGLAALAPWQIIRVDGVWGGFDMDWAWRWDLRAEDRTTRTVTNEAITVPPSDPADWPGFRGADRLGTSTATLGALGEGTLKELWRVELGPSWGSLCVVGDFVFTQDQLPEEERVACYKAATGERVWQHTDTMRHYDGMSGAGPRSTPTYHDGKLYTVGAKGLLNCLDANTGKPVWSVNLEEKYGGKPPFFGMASSVLIAGGRAYVHPGTPGGEGPRLLCLDAKTGEKIFAEGPSANGYSSPQLAALGGVAQVLVYNDDGLFGHDAASGKELWRHEWKAAQSTPTSVQPLVLPGDRVMIGGGGIGRGSRCLHIKRAGEGWAVELVWESKFTPNFNDVVVHKGKVFGLENDRLVCVEPASGEVMWRSRAANYKKGQLLLLGDALVVQTEQGGVVLLPLPPGRDDKGVAVKALKAKTWNHPAFARGRLFVRNAEEMVCFEVAK